MSTLPADKPSSRSTRSAAIMIILAVTLAAPALLVAGPATDSPVADATMRGDAATLHSLLENGADVNVPQADGMTALHWAAVNGSPEMAEMLLYAGAIVDARTRLGSYTPLHLASKSAGPSVVALLLEAGADATARTTTGGDTPLHLAAAAGNVESIGLLLDHGADPNARESAWEQTPLMFAAARNRVGAVQLLVSRGADVSLAAKVVDVVARDEADKEIARERNRRRDALRALEEEANAPEDGEGGGRRGGRGGGRGGRGGRSGGRNPAAGEEGAQPEKPAASGEAAAVEKPAEGGEAVAGEKPPEAATAAGEKPAAAGEAVVAEKPAEGATAAGEKPVEGAEAVPVAGEKPVENAEAVAADKKEPEAAAAGEEKPEGEADKKDEKKEPERPPSYVELVGGHGGLTALLYAAREGHVETAMALLDAGADVDEVSGGDHTSPLLIATLNGHFDLAMGLLARGADPHIASDAGATPLYVALNVRWAPRSAYPQQNAYKQQETSYLDLMKALLDAGADPNVRLTKHLWYTSFNFDHLLDSTGATPFWRAAYAQDIEAMRLLISHGADPNIPTSKLPSRGRPRPQGEDEEDDAETDPSGLPPVPVGGPAVYPLLTAAGAGYGEGFAGYAHQHVPDGWMPAVRYLVEELGADVNARDHNGHNAVSHAAARGDFEMILYLVIKGADPTVVSRKGQSTVDMANGPVQRVQPFPRAIWLLEHLGAINHHKCVSC